MPLRFLKLLLVEDSPHDAELALLVLESSGLSVQSTLAYTHLEVEALLGEQSFDLILCDFLLPGSSGVQVLQVAQQLAPQIPFIFLSGIFGEQHAVEMMRLGAIDYVLKQNLKLLPKAVKRAIAEVYERKQRRLAEDTLQEAEIRARLAIDAADMGAWDYHPQTGKLIWDERCKAFYELPADAEVNMDSFFAHCHPDERAALKEQFSHALVHGSAYQAEYCLRLPEAGALQRDQAQEGQPRFRERWLSSSGRALFEDGRCVRFSGVVQDISVRKQATQALQRSNEVLGERVEQRTRERDRTWELSRELLAVMRFDMTPVTLNPAWETTLGWRAEQLASMPLLDLLHLEDMDATIRETQSIASGNVSTRFVNRMRHADGSYRWLSWTIVPDAGLMYAAVRDITSEREVVDELAATNQRLREQIHERERVEAALQQMQRLEVVGQLTAGVAHDFNNLLTVILTSASFLSRDLERGTWDKMPNRLHSIQEAGERGAKLTGQLLAFSRRQRLEPVPVNLNDTVAGMRQLLERALGGGIWIESALADDLWSALVDPTQTEMIILNLAINARDAMTQTGTLRLATRNEIVTAAPQRPEHPEPGAYVVLSVGDSGSGMTEAVLAKAFEPFFTTKEVGKGSGLGLAQVFGFAKQSGGGVSIVTAENAGTTVEVFLPSIQEVAQEQRFGFELAPSVPVDNAAKTILLVDDDPQVRNVTAMMLDALGYHVIEAQSAQDALQKIEPHIELLLTDFAMPGMTGGELAERVREQYPNLPIVFITGFADIGALAVDDRYIVKKPYREDELATKLTAALQGG